MTYQGLIEIHGLFPARLPKVPHVQVQDARLAETGKTNTSHLMANRQELLHMSARLYPSPVYVAKHVGMDRGVRHLGLSGCYPRLDFRTAYQWPENDTSVQINLKKKGKIAADINKSFR